LIAQNVISHSIIRALRRDEMAGIETESAASAQGAQVMGMIGA
jgi:hypothetical protein